MTQQAAILPPSSQANTIPAPAPPPTPPAANTPVFDSTDIASLNAAWNYAISASNAASSWLQGFAATNALPAGMAIADYQAFIELIRECQQQEEQLFLNGQQIAPNPTIQGVNSLNVFAGNGLSYANQFMAYFGKYPGLSSATSNGAQIQALCQDAANAMSGPAQKAAAAVQAALTVANQGNAPAPPAAPPSATIPPVTPTPVSPPAQDTTVITPAPLGWWDTPGFMGFSNGELVIGGSILGVITGVVIYKISK